MVDFGGKQSRRKISKKLNRQAYLNINGIDTQMSKWRISPDKQILTSLDTKISVDLYNSVVKQNAVILKMLDKEPIELHLPLGNDDFSVFGAECGIGSRA